MSGSKAFFGKPQPAAVLKHEILRRYVVVFASKTGSQSAGRVGYVDGYAGAGSYEDGTPGSPALMIEAATTIGAFRQIRMSFVESDRDTYEKLVQLVDGNETEGMDIRVMFGSVEQHLDAILQAAGDDPLFVFLDPFGVGIDFEVLTQKILGRSHNNRPKTEVLLNFSVQAVDRIGGLIKTTAKSRTKTLERLDRTLGGDWWQPLYSNLTGPERTAAIANEYRARVSAAAGGWSGWTVPVSDSIAGRPEYLLMHFTQHRDGRWEFYQAMTFATEEWRKACHEANPSEEDKLAALGQFPLEGLEAPVPFEEDTSAWVHEITANATRLLDEGASFVLQDRLRDLLGRTLGLARETHIRQALKPLWKAGRLAGEPKGSLQRYVFAPAKPAT
jgi:three-Cys-motif partner protein